MFADVPIVLLFLICAWIKWRVVRLSSAVCVAKLTSRCAAAWWSPPCVWASSAPPWPWWEWSAQRSAAQRAPKPDWPPCRASTSFSAVNNLQSIFLHGALHSSSDQGPMGQTRALGPHLACEATFKRVSWYYTAQHCLYGTSQNALPVY